MTAMIRVLIADDSATVRALLAGLLRAWPEFEVVAQVPDGVEAVSAASRLRPDLVLMDLHMPGLDGIAATRRIMAEAPCPIVIVSASVRPGEVALGMRALQAGAVQVQPIPSPKPPDDPESVRLRETLVMLSQVKVVRQRAETHLESQLDTSGIPRARRWRGGTQRIVAIAASTGGPLALQQVLAALPPDFPAPILVVQHMAAGFIGGMARWLATSVTLDLRVARHGEKLEPGIVYLAPDDRHLGCAGGRIALSSSAPIGGFRPSASYLFASVAECAGEAAVGVIMTGMGSDGVEGLAVLTSRGGRVIAQNEESSVVYGMAREAVRAGLATMVVPLHDVARELLELV